MGNYLDIDTDDRTTNLCFIFRIYTISSYTDPHPSIRRPSLAINISLTQDRNNHLHDFQNNIYEYLTLEIPPPSYEYLFGTK